MMKQSLINNHGSNHCALETQTVDPDMPSSPDPFVADASALLGNVEPHRPTRRSDLSVRLIEGEVVVLDRRDGFIHQLNYTAGYIWDQCNGRFTVTEIANQLALAFDVDARIAAQDVAAIIHQFQNLRLLETP